MGAGQIPKIEKKNREFRGGYAAGIDDMKGIGVVGIVHVVEGDLKVSKLVYHHHSGGDVSEKYLKGWAQAIKDAHKGVSGGRR